MTKRKRYSNEFKAHVALEAIREELTLAELSKKHGVRLLPAGNCMQSLAGQCMRRGFLYLVAIMDWATRKVLAWRISNTLDADFCIKALKEALAKYGAPEIFNTPSRGLQANPCRAVDQGSQFTSYEFTQVLKDAEIKISMDGRGRWIPLVDCKQSPAGSG